MTSHVGQSLAKAAAIRVAAGRSAHTRASRAPVAWSASRVNGERSLSAASASDLPLRWFLIGVAFTQFANIVLALWVRAGA